MNKHELFNCYGGARLHTLPGAPTLRVATHEQRVEHRNRLEALNADQIVPRFGTDPDPPYVDPDDPEFKDESFAWGCHGMLVQEDFWQQMNIVWSWIDERPVWLSPVNWWLEVLPNPEVKDPQIAKIERSFRFTLLGGGQIKVIEHFKLWRLGPTDEWKFHRDECELRVTADAGEGLKRFTGVIDDTDSEQYAYAALFLPGTPQTIADRVAATFRLLTFANGVGTSCRGPDPENFSALLDRSSKCCLRRLLPAANVKIAYKSILEISWLSPTARIIANPQHGGEQQDCTLICFFVAWPPTARSIIAHSAWAAEIPDHACARLLQRSPRAPDLRAVLFEAGSAFLAADADAVVPHVGTDASVYLPAGDGVFAATVVGAKTTDGQKHFVYARAGTWLNAPMLKPDQKPLPRAASAERTVALAIWKWGEHGMVVPTLR
jgi:hypothetical protein